MSKQKKSHFATNFAASGIGFGAGLGTFLAAVSNLSDRTVEFFEGSFSNYVNEILQSTTQDQLTFDQIYDLMLDKTKNDFPEFYNHIQQNPEGIEAQNFNFEAHQVYDSVQNYLQNPENEHLIQKITSFFHDRNEGFKLLATDKKIITVIGSVVAAVGTAMLVRRLLHPDTDIQDNDKNYQGKLTEKQNKLSTKVE